MAVGNAVLDVVLADGFLAHVKELGLFFRQGLEGLKDRFPDVIEEIRGVGLMIGVKTKVPAGDLVQAARAEKMLTVMAGDNVVRVLPPLITTVEEAREGIARLEKASAHLEETRLR